MTDGAYAFDGSRVLAMERAGCAPLPITDHPSRDTRRPITGSHFFLRPRHAFAESVIHYARVFLQATRLGNLLAWAAIRVALFPVEKVPRELGLTRALLSHAERIPHRHVLFRQNLFGEQAYQPWLTKFYSEHSRTKLLFHS